MRRRRPMPMKILVPSCVPDATRTHAFRVYLSEALVYIYKRDLRPAQLEEEAGLAQGKHARQHRTAAARV